MYLAFGLKKNETRKIKLFFVCCLKGILLNQLLWGHYKIYDDLFGERD